jgi:hypothetical protein
MIGLGNSKGGSAVGQVPRTPRKVRSQWLAAAQDLPNPSELLQLLAAAMGIRLFVEDGNLIPADE